MPPEERTPADYLRGAGYATGLKGKWHLGFKSAYLSQVCGFVETIEVGYNQG